MIGAEPASAVCEPTSTETLKKSKRSLEDAKAVLVINGQLDGPSGKELGHDDVTAPSRLATVLQWASAFASQLVSFVESLICKHTMGICAISGRAGSQFQRDSTNGRVELERL